jgi:dTDP-4-dehydrorhamnose 3,5-epimerase
MQIIHTPIEGLVILEPRIFHDTRGYFYESYNQQKLKELGIDTIFVQDNQSYSQKGVIRGLHFQKPPFAQAKLVRVIKGKVLDVAVDIRKSSPTYGQHFSIILTGENHRQFLIPEGFAHGFVALEDDSIFTYKCSQFYHKEAEMSIRYNDPTLNINWGLDNAPIMTEKDLCGVLFDQFNTPFE